MRKLFSLIAAVLFAGSMMAQVTILPTDFTAVEASDYSVTKDGVTVAVTASTVTADQMRIFKNQSITISADVNITKIEFTCTANGTAKYGPGCFNAQEGYTFEADGKTGTWEGEAKSITFTAETNQVRVTEIVVTLDDDDDDNEEVVIYDWRGKTGFTTLGAAGVSEATVKIHENTDEYPAIKLANSYVYADGKWISIKPAEGGFKAGDVLYVAAVISNDATDGSKYAQVDVFAANGETNLFRGEPVVNGKKSADDPVTETFVLESDQDSLFIGRYGNTNLFVLTLMVGRGGEAPEEKLTFDFKVDQEGITITPSKDDPWAGMALPTAEITENFGTIDALVDAVKDMMEPIQGKATLKFEDLNPEEFPAGTECTFVAWGIVDGEVTGIGSVEFVVPAPLADPTNCAEAAEAALSVSENNELYNGGKEYTIEGYVTEIQTAYSDQYHNITFWMADEKDGGKVLEAYRAACAAEADAPAVGDKVKVTGALTKYNTTPEFAAGCTFVITEKAVPVDENEVVKLGFNLPTENRPADNSIEIAGSFVEGTMALEKIEATGWFLSYDFVKAVADDTFKLRDKSNNDLILCKYNEGKAIWEQAIFKFGDYWQDDTWKDTPCKLIEEDLSNAAEYAWKEGAPEPSEELADPTNCAEAAEAALSVSEDNELYNGGKEYTIEGYVTEIQTAWSSQYNNISFWMADEKDGGKVLEAYRAACASAEDAARVGDKVKVTGKLTKYGETPEFAAGCTYEIIERGEQPDPQNLGEKTIAEFLELKNKIDTCILTGAIDSLVNASYGNFNLVDETGKVYIYGLKDAEGNYCYEAKGLAEGDIITVLAVYSEYYGKPQVKNAIFVSKKSQGIDNTSVEIKVEKFFRDGQLIIRKNGIEYNVQGAVIK